MSIFASVPSYRRVLQAVIVYFGIPSREEAADVIKELYELSECQRYACHGDNERTAAAVAKLISQSIAQRCFRNISSHYKKLSMQQAEKGVIMVEMVNDAPALSESDVGNRAVNRRCCDCKRLPDINLISSDDLRRIVLLRRMGLAAGLERIDEQLAMLIVAFNAGLVGLELQEFFETFLICVISTTDRLY